MPRGPPTQPRPPPLGSASPGPWTGGSIVPTGVLGLVAAKKGNELEDRLRNFRIREQFVTNAFVVTSGGGGLSDELNKLASLKASGALTDEEFVEAKAQLLSA